MKREDIRNLLGGYAAGTLTPAEQKLLFDAALEDQELFDALADDQALKEILDDPQSRGFLRAALAEVAPPAPEKQKGGLWPLSWQWTSGLVTAAAALTIVTVISLQKTTETKPAAQVAAVKSESSAAPAKTKEPPVEVADARVANQPAPKAAPKPAAAPAPPPPAPVVATEARGEESKSTDKKKEAEAPAPQLAAAAPPPPASAPVLDTQRLPAPTASQLYLAQFRQTQMEQQQQQLPGGPARAAFSQMGRVAEKDAQQRRDQPEPPRTMAKTRAAENTAGGGVAPPADAIAPTRSIARNPGIRYEILRRNSQGQFIATRIDTRFEEGDEIVIAVNKNAGGIVAILQKQGSGWQALPLASQTLFDARTAPLKLTRGTLDLVVVLSAQQAASTPPAQTRSQVSETLGNAVYVVTPGQPEGPVAAQLRITVN